MIIIVVIIIIIIIFIIFDYYRVLFYFWSVCYFSLLKFIITSFYFSSITANCGVFVSWSLLFSVAIILVLSCLLILSHVKLSPLRSSDPSHHPSIHPSITSPIHPPTHPSTHPSRCYRPKIIVVVRFHPTLRLHSTVSRPGLLPSPRGLLKHICYWMIVFFFLHSHWLSGSASLCDSSFQIG